MIIDMIKYFKEQRSEILKTQCQPYRVYNFINEFLFYNNIIPSGFQKSKWLSAYYLSLKKK